jgi:hypothetical protein
MSAFICVLTLAYNDLCKQAQVLLKAGSISLIIVMYTHQLRVVASARVFNGIQLLSLPAKTWWEDQTVNMKATGALLGKLAATYRVVRVIVKNVRPVTSHSGLMSTYLITYKWIVCVCVRKNRTLHQEIWWYPKDTGSLHFCNIHCAYSVSKRRCKITATMQSTSGKHSSSDKTEI